MNGGTESEAGAGTSIEIGEVKIPARVTVSSKVTKIEYEALKTIASRCGVSVSQVIRAAVRAFIKELAARKPHVIDQDLRRSIETLDDVEINC